MKDLKLVIVGGGIGGFAAAIALAKDGHQITLLEAAPEFAEACSPYAALTVHAADALT